MRMRVPDEFEHRPVDVGFVILAAVFIAALVVCNIIAGKLVLVDLGWLGFATPFVLSAGALPYPVTFLATDLLSEIYGKRRANLVVLGHGRCGGIRAALNPGNVLAHGDFIGKWMSMLAPVSAEVAKYSFLTPTERETVLERLSVRNSIKNLRTFPYIKEREADGRLVHQQQAR